MKKKIQNNEKFNVFFYDLELQSCIVSNCLKLYMIQKKSLKLYTIPKSSQSLIPKVTLNNNENMDNIRNKNIPGTCSK